MLVRVPDVPVDLYFDSAGQLVEVLTRAWRELHDQHGGLPLPTGDVAAIEDLLHTYAPYQHAVAAQASLARDAGRTTFTLEVDLPASAADDVAYLMRLLARIEQLCADQEIALPSTPEIRAFRLGLFAAIAAQLASP